MNNPSGQLTARFRDALVYAAILHEKQSRKGTKIPYLAHLLGTASIVMEFGGDEDEAIAALLHDAVEDQGGKPVLENIRDTFGDRVAEIVQGCTDTMESPKPAWKPRKETYLAHLVGVNSSTALVSLADKLFNVRAILRDYKINGESVWNRFSGGKEGTLWYYQSLVEIFHGKNQTPLFEEFKDVVDDLIHTVEKNRA